MGQVVYAVLLSSIPKVGPRTYERLVSAFGSACGAAMATPQDHGAIGILNATQVERLQKGLGDLPRLEAWLDELSFDGIAIRTTESRDYPEMLRLLPSAPPVLYVKGELPVSEELSVALVGTRSPTTEGVEMARAIAGRLSEAGLCVVSGLAAGIDAAAHEGALDAGGRTVAILGSGLLRVHPPENQPLADRVVQQGALVSECFPTEHTSVSRLMARNRLQIAFSRAVIVVEMGDTRGSMAAVDQAVKQGRPVFAWVTDRDCPPAPGPRSLVEGKLAQPIRTLDDLAAVLDTVAAWSPPDLTDDSDEEPRPQLTLF